MHLVGFIKEFTTIHGHVNVKLSIDVSVLQKSNVAVKLVATLARIQNASIQVSAPTPTVVR